MRTSHYRYPVKLSEEQRRWLETMIQHAQHSRQALSGSPRFDHE